MYRYNIICLHCTQYRVGSWGLLWIIDRNSGGMKVFCLSGTLKNFITIIILCMYLTYFYIFTFSNSVSIYV